MGDRVSRGVLLCLAMLGLSLFGAAGAGASTAGASKAGERSGANASTTCTGSLEHPGVLSGTYSGNVTIDGVCAVDDGPATVDGELTVLPGGGLNAAYSGEPILTVTGNVNIGSDAAAVLGCELYGIECFDDAGATGIVRLGANLNAKGALGVVMHKGTVHGNVKQSGGGGGLNCENPGPGLYRTIGFPVYTDYEDSTVEGTLKVTGMRSCFLGMFRTHVLGNATLTNDLLAEPEKVNLAHDVFSRNLSCSKDSKFFFDSDTVLGKAKGECAGYEIEE